MDIDQFKMMTVESLMHNEGIVGFSAIDRTRELYIELNNGQKFHLQFSEWVEDEEI